MTAIQIMRNQRGDDEAHAGGCGHIARLRPYQNPDMAGWGGSTFRGATLREAIREADADMAGAFGQKVYEPNPDDQPWTVSVMAAPCLRKAMAAEGLDFDQTTGEAVAR
jgi:hypothetical protein